MEAEASNGGFEEIPRHRKSRHRTWNEAIQDYGFAEHPATNSLNRVHGNCSLAEHPATDTFHDDDIARRPQFPRSELESDRIRLVKIIPGSLGDMIECEVSMCSLKQPPSYTALSYTWGSPLGFREILVQGRPHCVAKNLWRFLDQARRLPDVSSLTGWLWIDALSIDQSNPQEKLDQVGIISSIFKNAEHVIVWLGPLYADSDHALTALRSNDTEKFRRSPKTLTHSIWSAIHSVCERPYWRRLWVYQELKNTQGAKLMCGHRLVPLQDLQKYLFDTVAPRLEDKVQALRESSAGKMLQLVADSAMTSLWSLIQKTSHLRCVDPRDKAYAVLNIARRGSRRGIEADYTITVRVLLNRILKNMHRMTPPGSLREVAEQCMELERLFGEPRNSMFVTQSGHVAYTQHKNPLEELEDHPDFKLQQLLNEWCVVYTHQPVRQLVSPRPRLSVTASPLRERNVGPGHDHPHRSFGRRRLPVSYEPKPDRALPRQDVVREIARTEPHNSTRLIYDYHM